MEEDARSLDYIEFQLSPKHTSRCNLFISVEGFREQVASGDVKLFASYLPQLEMQVERGKQRIILESVHGNNKWFTKATLERFVRFVNTPDVLESLKSLEDELLQLEQTQKWLLGGDASNERQLQKLNTHILKSHLEGEKDAADPSKNDLLRAMNGCVSALHQEQEILFSHATAAGFDENTVADLITFSDHFGADRLKHGCTQFLALSRKMKKKKMVLSCKSEDLMRHREIEVGLSTKEPAEDGASIFSLPQRRNKASQQSRHFESLSVDSTLAGSAFFSQRQEMAQNVKREMTSIVSKESLLQICVQSENIKDSDASEAGEEKGSVMKLDDEVYSVKTSIKNHSEEETPPRRLTVRAAISMFESKKKDLTDNSVQKLRSQESRKIMTQGYIPLPCVWTQTANNLQESGRNLDVGMMKNKNDALEDPSSHTMLTKKSQPDSIKLVQEHSKKSMSNLMCLDKLEQPNETSVQKRERQESCISPPCIHMQTADNSQENGRNLDVVLMKNMNNALKNPSSHKMLAEQVHPEGHNLVQENSRKFLDNLTHLDELEPPKIKSVRKLRRQETHKIFTQTYNSPPETCRTDNSPEKCKNLEVGFMQNKIDPLENLSSHKMLAEKAHCEAHNLVQANSTKSMEILTHLDELEQPNIKSVRKLRRKDNRKILTQSYNLPPQRWSTDNLQEKCNNLEFSSMSNKNDALETPSSHTMLAEQAQPKADNLVQENYGKSIDNLTHLDELEQPKDNSVQKLRKQESCKILTQSYNSPPQTWRTNNSQEKCKKLEVGFMNDALENPSSYRMLEEQAHPEADNLVQENSTKSLDKLKHVNEREQPKDNYVRKLRSQESHKILTQSYNLPPKTRRTDNSQEKCKNLEVGSMKINNYALENPSSYIMLTEQAQPEADNLVQENSTKSMDRLIHLDELEWPKDNSVIKFRRQESRKILTQRSKLPPETWRTYNSQAKCKNLEVGSMKNINDALENPSSYTMLAEQEHPEADNLVQENSRKSMDKLTHLDELERPKDNSVIKIRRQESRKILTQSYKLPPQTWRTDKSQEKCKNLEVGPMKNNNDVLDNHSSLKMLANQTQSEAIYLVEENSKKIIPNLKRLDKLEQAKETSVRKLRRRESCKILSQSCSSPLCIQTQSAKNSQEKGRNLEVELIENRNDAVEDLSSHNMLILQSQPEADNLIFQENSKNSMANFMCLNKLEQSKKHYQYMVADVLPTYQCHQCQNPSENTLVQCPENCVRLDHSDNFSNSSVDSAIPSELKLKLSIHSMKNHVIPVEKGQSIPERSNLDAAEMQEKYISETPNSKRSMINPANVDKNGKQPTITAFTLPASTSTKTSEQGKIKEASGNLSNESQENLIIRKTSSIPALHRSNVSVQYFMNNSEQSITKEIIGVCDDAHSLVNVISKTAFADLNHNPSSDAFVSIDLHMIALMKMVENQQNNNEEMYTKRGRFYKEYSRLRDARLKSEHPSKKEEREAKMKSMQKTLLQRNFELETKAIKFSRKHSHAIRSEYNRMHARISEHVQVV